MKSSFRFNSEYLAAAMMEPILANILSEAPPDFDIGRQKPTCIEGRTSSTEEQRMLAMGLKKFYYRNGNFVYAINQKIADKKAKKKGYL